jgi:hypothetical protein
MIYGYIYMLGFLLMLLAALAIYCYFRIHSTPTTNPGVVTTKDVIEEKANQLQNMGYLSEISKFQSRKFGGKNNVRNSSNISNSRVIAE